MQQKLKLSGSQLHTIYAPAVSSHMCCSSCSWCNHLPSCTPPAPAVPAHVLQQLLRAPQPSCACCPDPAPHSSCLKLLCLTPCVHLPAHPHPSAAAVPAHTPTQPAACAYCAFPCALALLPLVPAVPAPVCSVPAQTPTHPATHACCPFPYVPALLPHLDAMPAPVQSGHLPAHQHPSASAVRAHAHTYPAAHACCACPRSPVLLSSVPAAPRTSTLRPLPMCCSSGSYCFCRPGPALLPHALAGPECCCCPAP
jgi:hypothetical protein